MLVCLIQIHSILFVVHSTLNPAVSDPDKALHVPLKHDNSQIRTWGPHFKKPPRCLEHEPTKWDLRSHICLILFICITCFCFVSTILQKLTSCISPPFLFEKNTPVMVVCLTPRSDGSLIPHCSQPCSWASASPVVTGNAYHNPMRFMECAQLDLWDYTWSYCKTHILHVHVINVINLFLDMGSSLKNQFLLMHQGPWPFLLAG